MEKMLQNEQINSKVRDLCADSGVVQARYLDS